MTGWAGQFYALTEVKPARLSIDEGKLVQLTGASQTGALPPQGLGEESTSGGTGSGQLHHCGLGSSEMTGELMSV